MDETGIVSLPGHLDPRAQEFRPRNPSPQIQISLLQPQIYYPFASSFSCTGVHVMPFYDGGIGYQPSSSTAYLSPSGTPPPPPSGAATRVLLLSSVPTNVTEATVRKELEVFGEVRAVQMEWLQDGIVTVHFYDLRHAQAAIAAIREQHMQQQRRLRQHYNTVVRNFRFEVQNLAVPVPPPGRGLIAGLPVWAQFTLPEAIAGPDGHNQGTVVIFNLDSGVSASKLKEIFEAFGPVKELRETPLKRHQRFVEFFDIRDAARAISKMDGKEINGKRVLIEFSRPGGHRRKFSNAMVTSSTTHSNYISSFNNRNNRSSYYTRITNFPTPPSPPPPLPPKLFGRLTSDAPLSISSPQPKYPVKKSGFSSGNITGNNSRRPNYYGNGCELERNCNGSLRMNAKKSYNNGNNYSSATKQQEGKQPRSRPWKGRQRNSEAFFQINGDAMVESSSISDSRTTVMIKNIPNKYSQKLLLNMLDNHCIHCNEQIADGDDQQPLSSYDFVYLPIDFNNKCNVGYGFVNLTSPQATLRLYKAFHLQPWDVYNSRKICEVTYARLQGLEALKEHFKSSKFACETDEYLPIVFSPPRDGKQVTEPMAIGGHANPVNKKQLLIGNFDSGKAREGDEMDGEDRLDDHDDDDDDGGNSNGGDGNDDDFDDANGESSRLPEVLFTNKTITISNKTTATPPNGCLLSTEPQQQQALSRAQVS